MRWCFALAFASIVLLPGRMAGTQGVPQTMSFLGHLTDANGQPLEGSHSLYLKIYDIPAGGVDLWNEVHTGVTVEQGLIYLDLGSETALPGGLFTGDMRYLEVTVDGTSLSPRLPLQSVPYAMRAGVAQTAENLGAYPAADYVRRTELAPGATGGALTCATFDIGWADWCLNYQTSGGACDTDMGYRVTGQSSVEGWPNKTCICCRL